MAIAGTGSVVVDLFKARSGMNFVSVPYRGSSPAMIDLMSGQVQVMITTMASAGGNIRSGKLRALAVDRRITFPVFDASSEQRENMLALLALIETADEAERDAFTRVELNRELGRFDEARQALQRVDQEDIDSVCRLALKLVDQCHAVPVQYVA